MHCTLQVLTHILSAVDNGFVILNLLLSDFPEEIPTELGRHITINKFQLLNLNET